MEFKKVVISTDEMKITAEKMLFELNQIKSSFEEAYIIAKTEAQDDETLQLIRADKNTASEICAEMKKFICMMQYVCSVYSDCAENIRNMINEIYI